LQWWAENEHLFPRTAKLAYKVLTAQGTQCDVERNLSVAGLLLDELRQSMTEDTLHELLFLFENRHLWGADMAHEIFTD
jgi:hypothetical protein